MKKFIILIILIVLVIIGVVVYMGSLINSDGVKFKKEYEEINNKKTGYGKKRFREINIPRKNKIKYSSAKEIINKMNDKESFVVYFGFKRCPWCRSIMEELIKASNDSKADTLYYVDVLKIRDVKELKDGKVSDLIAGDEDYMQLIELMDNVLDEYTLEDEDGKEVKVGEKRIYAPNVIAVVDGKAVKMTTGLSPKLKDPYMKLTDEIKNYAYKNFKCVMNCSLEKKKVCVSKKAC